MHYNGQVFSGRTLLIVWVKRLLMRIVTAQQVDEDDGMALSPFGDAKKITELDWRSCKETLQLYYSNENNCMGMHLFKCWNSAFFNIPNKHPQIELQ